jgi:hypothetical protein
VYEEKREKGMPIQMDSSGRLASGCMLFPSRFAARTWIYQAFPDKKELLAELLPRS